MLVDTLFVGASLLAIAGIYRNVQHREQACRSGWLHQPTWMRDVGLMKPTDP